MKKHLIWFYILASLVGCMSVPRPPLKLVSTSLSVKRTTARYLEPLSASVPYDSIENEWWRYKSIYPEGYRLKVVMTNDSIWPPQSWTYKDSISDSVVSINKDSLFYFRRLSMRESGRLYELASWVSDASDSTITVRCANGSLPYSDREIKLKNIRHLIIDRRTRNFMRLNMKASDKIFTSLQILTIIPIGYAPFLAFGRWHGLGGSYIERYLLIVGGSGALIGVSQLCKEIFYTKRDRQYIIVSSQRMK